jgi:hypothetical protein
MAGPTTSYQMRQNCFRVQLTKTQRLIDFYCALTTFVKVNIEVTGNYYLKSPYCAKMLWLSFNKSQYNTSPSGTPSQGAFTLKTKKSPITTAMKLSLISITLRRETKHRQSHRRSAQTRFRLNELHSEHRHRVTWTNKHHSKAAYAEQNNTQHPTKTTTKCVKIETAMSCKI